MPSIARMLGLTAVFVLGGAVGGAVCALLSLTPVWVMEPSFLATEMAITIICLVGAVCGAVVMPVIGWLLIGRVTLGRILVWPTVGAIIGSNLAWVITASLQTDVLVTGAFLGAVAGGFLLRLTSPARNRKKTALGRS